MGLLISVKYTQNYRDYFVYMIYTEQYTYIKYTYIYDLGHPNQNMSLFFKKEYRFAILP